ncbi:hypothetical protein H1Q63_33255 [Desmonostoc muscorum CCALA 125]|nr:hypothetical protein [Desmonostoc muscorum CCALA 125]
MFKYPNIVFKYPNRLYLFTRKTVGKAGGLGLAIAQQIIVENTALL